MSYEEDIDPVTQICRLQYPNFSDVLQATSQLPYWQNGPDPLDYVNIYSNYDDKYAGLYSHFHYVSLGLSDIYGDERVHKKSKLTTEPSGYGYELSIKIKKSDSNRLFKNNSFNDNMSFGGDQSQQSQQQPPKWPIKLLQSLAKYTFDSGCLLDVGDHIPNVLVDYGTKVKHLLVASDSQLPTSQTKYGKVKFLQLVGCTDEELEIAQKWSCKKLLDSMRKFKEYGHEYLLTDLNRTNSILDIDQELKRSVSNSIDKDGSYLSFVKSNCFWKLNPIKELITSDFNSYNEIKFYCDFKTANLFPLILRGRLEKSNSFIFNGLDGHNLILIPDNFTNEECQVSSKCPLKASRRECQVHISKSLIDQMFKYFNSNSKLNEKYENSAIVNQPVISVVFSLDNNREYLFSLNIIDDDKIFDFYENFE